MFKIRKFNKGEEETVINIVEETLLSYGLLIDLEKTDVDLLDIEKYYFKNNGWFAVIEFDGNIVGSYGLFRIDDSSCELRKMYLQQGFQGKGIGHLMMNNAIEKAKELGYSSVMLETNRLLDRAIKLYEKYGFKQCTPQHLSTRCDYAMRKEI